MPTRLGSTFRPHQPERHALNPQYTPNDAQAPDRLVTVVYVSSATVEFSEVDLALLLSQSRLNNQPRKLSGMLLYRDGRFLQVLEGPQGAVREVLATIERDPRHTAVQTLVDEGIDRRRFGSWAMGYRSIRDAAATDVPEWFGSPEALRDQGGSRIGDLLEWFRAG